jgi:hypothetical protein
MHPIVRSIGLVFLGVAITVALIFGIELLNERLFHFMQDVDTSNTDALRAAVANLPLRAFLLLLVGYFIGTFCGAWVAARLTPGRLLANTWPMAHAMSVGLVVLIAGLPTLFGLPHPPWFYLAYFIVFPLAAYLAGWLVLFWRSRPAPSP